MGKFSRWSIAAVGVCAAVVATTALPLAAQAAPTTERYIVAYTPGNSANAHAALKQHGAKVHRELANENAVAVELTPTAAAAMSTAKGVAYVEPDVKRYPMATGAPSSTYEVMPYGISLVQADQVTSPNPGAITVGIIDSGLYTGHEDVAASLASGADVAGTGSWSRDYCGHGTHVAGTIAAPANGKGVVGVDPGATLYITKVFGDDCAWAYSSDLVAAVNANMKGGVKVISMSLGGTSSSRTEQKAMDAAYAKGILLIAAAGNDGNTRTSYPAGYASVMSVAAVDSTSAVADFSQKNKDVEISAPGVGVMSTTPFASAASVAAGGVTYSGSVMEGSATTSGINATMVNGGLCDASSSAFSGKVVLCQRGTISFEDKANNVIAGGGKAAIIYNNVAGDLAGTVGATKSIPVISVSDTAGAALLGSVGTSVTVVATFTQPASGYEAWDGTSMATPHVSGVAAKIWSFNPSWTNVQVRTALTATAKDLGTAGRDNSYGYGLVQAKAALAYLQSH